MVTTVTMTSAGDTRKEPVIHLKKGKFYEPTINPATTVETVSALATPQPSE